jgi:N-acetylglucosamine kinase-like BadF-type ATPase
MGYVLGVDGGNTKTLAVVGTLDGAIVGVGRSGCSDIYACPTPEAAIAEVETAVSAALKMAGISVEALEAGAFSMAGADWPEDYALIEAALARRGLGRRIVVVNDGLGALRAGSPDGTGVVVVCGTGTATAARSPDGRNWHSSWWQEVQGANHLGLKALSAVYRAELGIDPPTSLTNALLRYFDREQVVGVLYEFNKRAGDRPPYSAVSGLARVLLDEAQAGDTVARGIAEEHGAALGDYALAAARMVGIEGMAFTLALAGGVIRHPSRILPEALIARVHTTSPEAQPVYARFEPAIGAYFLALEAAGVTVDEPLLLPARQCHAIGQCSGGGRHAAPGAAHRRG